MRASGLGSWYPARTRWQAALIVSTLLGSWRGMQAAHESGHALAALLTGGEVAYIVLHPLTLSHTELIENPHPLVVVWAGPLIGVTLPLALWALAAKAKVPGAFVARFFAGFCLIANGAYLGVGSFFGTGDCGEMFRHGTPAIWLRVFGAVAVPAGFWLWNGQGTNFGLAGARGTVDHRSALVALVTSLLLVILGLVVGGE